MVGLGAVAAHVSRGLGRKSLEELGERLDSSDAALVVAGSTTLAGLVRPALVSAEEVRTTPLSVDIDQLGADARAAQREARGDLYPRSDAAMTRT